MSIEQLLTENEGVRRYVLQAGNEDVRAFLGQDPDVARCLAAMSGAPGTTLDDVACCYSVSDDDPVDDEPDEEAQEAQWRTYASHLGLPVGDDEARELAELSEEERAWLRYCVQVGLRP